MISVEEALARIVAPVTATGQETLALADGAGRVLAEDLVAGRSQPPAAVSAMDGYAVIAADITSPEDTLSVAGESAAGSVPASNFSHGTAVRIFTGAPVPQGADTVVIQEDVDVLPNDRIKITEMPVQGANIRPAGVDFKKGDICLRAGQRLSARDLSLVASLNYPWLSVHQRPSVGILATGDELVRPGEMPGAAGIVSSTVYGLSAYVRSWGGRPVDLGIAKDDKESLVAAISSARDLDLLVTLGGASVGDYDLVRGTLEDMGMKLDFWKIAMRPGKPLMYGALEGKPVLGLPGNPVSAFVCSLLFLQPMVRKMSGDTRWQPELQEDAAPVSKPLSANGSRQDYMRARLLWDEDRQRHVEPFDLQDSSVVSIFANSNCLIVRPPNASAVAAGDTVRIMRLDD